ncbi:hypothetical protein AWENTII_000126 [Aspergillus wentii]
MNPPKASLAFAAWDGEIGYSSLSLSSFFVLFFYFYCLHDFIMLIDTIQSRLFRTPALSVLPAFLLFSSLHIVLFSRASFYFQAWGRAEVRISVISLISSPSRCLWDSAF